MNAVMERGITIRRAVPADAPLLARLAAATFLDTFAADNDPQDLAAYMSTAFGEDIQRAELQDSECAVFLAGGGGGEKGYLMLRDLPVPGDGGDANAMQVVRLYVARDAIGTGVGAALMRYAIAAASERGRTSIWLTTWERNVRAIAFYRRFEFQERGLVPFMLGRDRQTDLLLVRRAGADR